MLGLQWLNASAETNSDFCYSNSCFINDQIPNNWSTHTHTHRDAYIHAHTHAHTHAHKHTHTCTHTCTHAHTHAHKHTHTCTQAHTHMHTHTQSSSGRWHAQLVANLFFLPTISNDSHTGLLKGIDLLYDRDTWTSREGHYVLHGYLYTCRDIRMVL